MPFIRHAATIISEYNIDLTFSKKSLRTKNSVQKRAFEFRSLKKCKSWWLLVSPKRVLFYILDMLSPIWNENWINLRKEPNSLRKVITAPSQKKIKFRTTTTKTAVFFRWHICKRWCRHVVSPLFWILKWCESTENRCVRTTTTDEMKTTQPKRESYKTVQWFHIWMVENDIIAMNDHWWKIYSNRQTHHRQLCIGNYE